MKDNKVFNNENSTKTNVGLIIVGIFIIAVSVLFYDFNYDKIDSFDLFKFENEIMMLSISVIFFCVGTTLFISAFNLKNSKIKFILLAILFVLLVAAIKLKPMRVAFIVLVVSLILFILTKIFNKVFSTIITFSFSCFLIMLFFKLLMTITPELQALTMLYISITLWLLLYNIFGVKLNQLCLKNILGYDKNKVKQYDYQELKNQINLLYLIIFVILNLSYLFNSQTDISSIANCVNNAFITGVCITNVNWKSLYEFGEKKKA